MGKQNQRVIPNETNRFLDSVSAQASKSTYRLAYHIAAPANWINDPNGLIQYKGEYHVFYQHHPYSAEWGPMHWGHVKSKDLVHWEHLPIALAPGNEYDRDGCFSGSAVDDHGVLTLIYTGNVWLNQEQTELRQVQCIATSSDAVTFTKDPSNPVIGEPPEVGSAHFRDPKVWRYGDQWYMVLGTKQEDRGKVVLYRSTNLRSWIFVGVVSESDGTLGYMWECPDLFSLGGKDILLFSPQGIEPSGDRYLNLHQTGYVVGHLDYTTGKLSHGTFEELDKGFDFYAAQTFEDDKGRRILIGWMDMWESQMPTQKDGWAGALTLPRLLELNANNHLLMKPVPELEKLRGKKHERIEQFEIKGSYVPKTHGECLELLVEFSLESCEATEFGIKVRCSEDGKEHTTISYDRVNSQVIMDRNASGIGPGGIRRAKMEESPGSSIVRFHLFLDRSSLELFVNDGELVMTSRIYPAPTSRGIEIFSINGSVKLLSFESWDLEDIWLS